MPELPPLPPSFASRLDDSIVREVRAYAAHAVQSERERLTRVCEQMKATPEQIAAAGKTHQASQMILGNLTLDFCADLIRKA